MLNATRELKGLGVRRKRNPLPLSPIMRIIPVLNQDGTTRIELLPFIPKEKKSKQYPQGKY